MGGGFAVVHDVGKKQQRVVALSHAAQLFATQVDPLVKHLFQIVWRDLGANNLARFDGKFDRVDELALMGVNFELDKVRTNVGGHLLQRDRVKLAG